MANTTKVHGSVLSTATRRVLVCLYEKGLEFEFVPVNMAVGEHKKEAFLSLNGTPLVTPGRQMATLSVWMEVEAHHFEPAASKLNWELCFKPLFKIPTDTAAVEENEAKLAKVLDIYESRLTQSKYLGGDSFTLADLHHLPSISYLMGTQIKKLFDSRPHVSAWVADITSRPAWSKVVAMN
ncbi:unnamed protein product [Dovyalis caffra]|uniref:glutathione transferase n=1 Tax=Dovyalis caffra TaxID=77055 RepID=A0AAV1SAB3_9ROSI|nr:unnamed protein product [Dovyalis caffra]